MVHQSPLDDVEFLARSAHRVDVLQTLRSGPWTRPDLHAETGISQPTLGRVLGSLQDRNWVERDGREYRLTAFGELVAEEFDDLLDTFETVQRLGDVVPLLPTDEMDFDLRLFGDSTVLTPAADDAYRFIRRVERLVYEAETLRLVSITIPPGTIEDHRNQHTDFIESTRTVEGVISGEILDNVRSEPDLLAIFSESPMWDRIDLYRYDGTIPLMVGVADGTAFLVPTDDYGAPAALVETEHETIRGWVEDRIDAYIAQSTRLSPDDLQQ